MLKLTPEKIESAKIHRFSLLRDFGGWGIRVNRQMTAYYMRGNVGVRIATGRTRDYLIGSEKPERLLEVIEHFMKSSNTSL
jgi:hypothetical protein